jgi:hypothetical protein
LRADFLVHERTLWSPLSFYTSVNGSYAAG